MVESLSRFRSSVSAFSVLQPKSYFYNVFKSLSDETVEKSGDSLTAKSIFPH